MEDAALVVRPMRADDADEARALLSDATADGPYAGRLRELLGQALTGVDDEARGLVVEHDATMAAVAVHGVVAGSVGAARLHFLVARAGDDADRAAGALLRAIASRASADGARFLIAELPDDPAAERLVAPLRRHGFREDARVADFYGDGVDLLFLRLTLRGDSGLAV